MIRMNKIFFLILILFYNVLSMATELIRSNLSHKLNNTTHEVDNLLFSDVKSISTLPDPATWQSYDCVQSQNITYPTWNWGLVTARVFRPIWGECNADAAPPANRPVVVFFNGAGYGYYDYDYIANHMAGLGFIVVVVASDEPSPTIHCTSNSATCIDDRARKGLSYLHYLQWFWNYRSYADFSNLIMMGHSRGGEAAIEAASIIRWEDPWLGNPGVRAVIALAPTDVGDGITNRRQLTGEESPNFLLLYGSRDEQIRGYPSSNFPPISPPQTAFALYDRAGTEASLEGDSPQPENIIEKSMHFIWYANHEHFSDKTRPDDGCNPQLMKETQHITTKGLVNAYLFWKIWGVEGYKEYFDGSYDWLWWTATMQQFSSGAWGSRRVIDNFQNNILGDNTMGGSLSVHGNLDVTISDNWVTSAYGTQRMVHGPEDGLRLRVESGTPSPSNILQWSIPAFQQDVSDFTHLSIRIGLGLDDKGQSRVSFRLKSSGWSPILSSASYGGLPEIEAPDGFITIDCPLGSQTDQAVVSMRTIRIPLEDFNINPHKVSHMQIRFDHTDTEDRVFFVDNLEFTK